jgi:hypothetical protein
MLVISVTEKRKKGMPVSCWSDVYPTCKTNGQHYRNLRLYRVLDSLPSAFCRALGKEDSTESRTRQSPALGNELIYQV